MAWVWSASQDFGSVTPFQKSSWPPLLQNILALLGLSARRVTGNAITEKQRADLHAGGYAGLCRTDKPDKAFGRITARGGG